MRRQELEQVLRERFNNLDIRSDQCEMIRIITHTVVVGCSAVGDLYEAKVVSLEPKQGGFDFETKLLAVLAEDSPESLATALQPFLHSG
jgi:hypothetical protein